MTSVLTSFLERIARAAGIVLGLAFLPQQVNAQPNVQLTFGKAAVSFSSPTPENFTSSSLEASAPLPYEVSTSSEPAGSFTATVYIRSTSATLGQGKPLADLEWRRGDDQSWHALTMNDAIIEYRTTTGAAEGHTWNNTIYFRVALHWTSDSPADYLANLLVTVSTTAP